MSGWTFAGWVVAVIAAYALMLQVNRANRELDRVEAENRVLWEQLERFDAAYAETRARQAVTN